MSCRRRRSTRRADRHLRAVAIRRGLVHLRERRLGRGPALAARRLRVVPLGDARQGVPPRTCVQSRSDSVWYQCNAAGWQTGVADGAGPLGTCAAEYSL